MVPGRRKTTIWLNVGNGAMVNAYWVGEIGTEVVRTGRDGRMIPTGESGAVAIDCCVRTMIGRMFYVAVEKGIKMKRNLDLLNS